MEIERGKVRTREEIMACFKDGQTIAIGGQAGAYMPWDLLDMLEESGVKHLTICSIDACNPGFAISRLIENGQVDKMITTHIGNKPCCSEVAWQKANWKLNSSQWAVSLKRCVTAVPVSVDFLPKQVLAQIWKKANRLLQHLMANVIFLKKQSMQM